MTMLKNYLKIAWRNLQINRLYSLLNISGLAVGLACGILILLWIVYEFDSDRYHKNLSDIYLLMQNQTVGGEIHTGSATPAPLATKVRGQIPDIKYIARTGGGGPKLLNTGDESSYEEGLYADPDLFNIMTFPAIAGDPVAALHDASAIVVTESTAKKWFGNQDPVGKIVRLDNTHDLHIAAVIKDIPSNSMFRFNVALPFSLFERGRNLKWDNNSFMTWLQLAPGATVPDFDKKVNHMVSEMEGEVTLFAYPLSKLNLYSEFSNGKPNGGKIYVVLMMAGVGIFILLLACINFMNLSTARFERRAREVGIRKAIGSRRIAIAGQFLSESLLLTFIGLALSIVLTQLTLPAFSHLIGKDLSFGITSWRLWALLLLLGLCTGVAAGSYPAFFLSSFKPVRVLKGVISSGKGNSKLRKTLVTFQFFISVFLIISTIVIFKQLKHVQNRPLGYDQENLIEIPALGDMAKRFDVIKRDLMQIADVSNVSAGSDNLLRTTGGITGLQWPDKDPGDDFPVAVTWVNYDWVNTAGLKIVEGRDFSSEFGSDNKGCLLNQTAVKRMDLKEPLGSLIGSDSHVIGVVEDFVYNNPSSNPRPLVIFFSTENLSHFFIRFRNDNNWQQRIADIREVFKKHNPNQPFEFHFTKEEYEKSFREIVSVRQTATLFSSLAIFIACLGLFGLSGFVAERREKEIGVRKVLGASVANISLSLSRDFLQPVLFSFVIATPLVAWTMQKMLLSMDYHIQLSWWMFALGGLAVVLVAMLTVAFQSMKAALTNPAKSLRTE